MHYHCSPLLFYCIDEESTTCGPTGERPDMDMAPDTREQLKAAKQIRSHCHRQFIDLNRDIHEIAATFLILKNYSRQRQAIFSEIALRDDATCLERLTPLWSIIEAR